MWKTTTKAQDKTNNKEGKKKKTPHCEGYLQRGPLPGGSDLREIWQGIQEWSVPFPLFLSPKSPSLGCPQRVQRRLALYCKFRQNTERWWVCVDRPNQPAVIWERFHYWPGGGQVRGGSGRCREGVLPGQKYAEFSVQPKCQVSGSERGDAHGWVSRDSKLWQKWPQSLSVPQMIRGDRLLIGA